MPRKNQRLKQPPYRKNSNTTKTNGKKNMSLGYDWDDIYRHPHKRVSNEIEGEIINLTPHDITIFNGGNQNTIYPTSGLVARAKKKSHLIGRFGRTNVYKTTFGKPYNLPEPQDGVYYIVSTATAHAVKVCDTRTTDDLLLGSRPVKDVNGRILGFREFTTI